MKVHKTMNQQQQNYRLRTGSSLSKSTGPDGLLARLIKDGAEFLKTPISFIINYCNYRHVSIISIV